MIPTALSRILYVEDDPDIRGVAQMALEVLGGFTVLACGAGREALEPASLAFAPDMILLDVMMPDMDGPTTLMRLREQPQLAQTPAVFMTAKVEDDAVRFYLSMGVLGVIAKPFDPMLLSSQIRALWEAGAGAPVAPT